MTRFCLSETEAPALKPVKFARLPESARHKTIESGMPLVLQCEIADPEAPVSWYKDGIQLQTKNGLVIQSEGRVRRLVVPTAELRHSGVYNCEAMDDVIKFKVYVKGDLKPSLIHVIIHRYCNTSPVGHNKPKLNS